MTSSTNFSKNIAVVAALSLAALMPLFAHAADTAASSTVQQKEEVAQDVDTNLNAFLQLKDDTSIPENQKEEKKAELRKDILAGVLKLSYAEIDELSSQLKSLSDLNDQETAWRDGFLKDLQGYHDYYDTLGKNTADAVSLDDIKALKAWRDGTYSPHVRTIVNFSLGVQERTILKTGFERYKKIETDVLKLSQGGYLNSQQSKDLIDMLGKAKHNLDDAQTLSKDGYALLVTQLTATSTPSATTTLAELSTTTPATATSTDLGDASSTSAETPLSPQTEINSKIQTSLGEIKDAYKIFLAMSQTVKTILGL